MTATATRIELYISGRLTILSAPRGVCGEWIFPGFFESHAFWHRRLDAHAFLWLRSAVNRAIESGKLSDDYQDALSTLDWIRSIGIEHGAFSAEEVADYCRAPEWYEFNSGLPRWADEY